MLYLKHIFSKNLEYINMKIDLECRENKKNCLHINIVKQADIENEMQLTFGNS